MASVLPVIALPVQRAAAAVASDPIITVAGNGFDGVNGDGGRATDAQLKGPAGVARDGAGNVFVADYEAKTVRKVDTFGRISTVAGNPNPSLVDSLNREFTGNIGDGGPATQATLDGPRDVAVDGAGNLYIADNGRVRRVDGASGTITTVGGGGAPADGVGDGGPATQARLGSSLAVTFDHDSLYIADAGDNRVRRVDLGTGTISTVAGNGQQTSSGDSGPATEAGLNPTGTTLDAAGNLYIADNANYRIRKVDALHTITTVVAGIGGPRDVAVSATGHLSVSADGGVYDVDPAGVVTVLAGANQAEAGYSGDGGPASAARLKAPLGIDLDASGALFIADSGNHRVRRVGPDRLALTMTHSPAATVGGQPLTYTLDVRTLVGTPATGVVLTDPLPAGATFRSASASQGSCGQVSGKVTCSLGDMAPAATARATITVTVPSGGAALTTTATVAANESDTFPNDDTFTDVAGPATVDVSVAIADAPDPAPASTTAKAGPYPVYSSPLTYTVTVANAGPGPATERST